MFLPFIIFCSLSSSCRFFVHMCTEEDYVAERGYLVDAFVPLLEKCKELDRCIRIGTNHGSLSARVLSFYGDTPRGMV